LKKTIVYITILAIAFRAVLTPFFEQPFDIDIWRNEITPTFRDFFGLYVNSPMTRPGNPIFPPLFYVYVGSILFLFPFKVYFISALGLLNIVFDITIGALIYNYIVKNKNMEKNRALFIYALWLFSPIVWITSAVWKQLDPITDLLTLLAFLNLEKNKIARSGIFLSLATLFKLYPIIFLPIFIIWVYRSSSFQKVRNIAKWLFAFSSVFFLISFPFLIRDFNSFVYRVFILNLFRGVHGAPGPSYVGGIDGINFLFFMRVHFATGYLNFVQPLEILVPLASFAKFFLIALVCLLFFRQKLSFTKVGLAIWTSFFALSSASNEQYFVLPLLFLLLYFTEQKYFQNQTFIILNLIWVLFEELRMGLDSAYIYGFRVYQRNPALAWIDRNFYGLLLDWHLQVIVLSVLGVLMSIFLICTLLKIIGYKFTIKHLSEHVLKL
jgi:hypothetical protein